MWTGAAAGYRYSVCATKYPELSDFLQNSARRVWQGIPSVAEAQARFQALTGGPLFYSDGIS